MDPFLLGDHCSLKSCNRLDFLPVVCDCCKEKFCKDHFSYENHSCPKSYTKNAIIPTCPLCNQLVPKKPSMDPNDAIDYHIRSSCKPPFELPSQKCSLRKCKTKDLIPVKCGDCHQQFCIPHRFPDQHGCMGVSSQSSYSISEVESTSSNKFNWLRAGSKSNEKKIVPRPVKTTPVTSLDIRRMMQGNCSEAEALARALEESSQQTNGHINPANCVNNSLTPVEENVDEDLARALAASLLPENMEPGHSNKTGSSTKPNSTSCSLS